MKFFYSVSSKNGCGVIIFPDSIQPETKMNAVLINMRPTDSHAYAYNFSLVTLRNTNTEKRLAILKELQACPDLVCKIEKLKTHNATLDILSLLKLEKMKDPQNKTIDKLYWEFVSQIRYDFSYKTWER